MEIRLGKSAKFDGAGVYTSEKSKTTRWTEMSGPINSLTSMTDCWPQRDQVTNRN